MRTAGMPELTKRSLAIGHLDGELAPGFKLPEV